MKIKTPLIGSWIQTGNAVAAEILAGCGFDWIAVDMEHTETDYQELTNIFRAISFSDTLPLVRVSQNDTIEIRRVLDCGAAGVIVPLVENAGQAQRAVAAAKYPPNGVRGFAYCRANGWGMGFEEYAENANTSVMVAVMIESRNAVENIDSILSVAGVDAVFIGPYDLSGSYGFPGDTNHPSVVAAKKRVLDACKKHKKVAGQHIVVPTQENVSHALSEGYTFLALGMDTVFLSAGAKHAASMADSIKVLKKSMI